MEFLLFLENSDVISMQFKLVSVNETILLSLKATHLFIDIPFS